MKEGCKVSCIKIVVGSVVAKEATNTLMFYISKYGAACSAQSGAK